MIKKRGRPIIQVTSTDLDELKNFIDSLLFLSKQQERFNQISNKTDKTDFSDDQIKLIKSNLREMKVHKKRIETLEII